MKLLPAIKDYRELARKRLPRIAYDYLEGGAEDLRTLTRNRAVFENLLFRPRVMRNVASIDTSVTVFGRRQSFPAVVGPTGLNGLYWPRAEEALAKAAHEAGLPFAMSTASTSLFEDVRAVTHGDIWLQLYVQQDRRIAETMMARAKALEFSTLILTVDTAVHGKRDHDVRNNFKIPLPITPRLVLDLATHPRWCFRMARQRGAPQLVNLAKSAGVQVDMKTQASTLSRKMDMALTWDAVSWLRDQWAGKIVIKGILSVEDALLAKRYGVDGVSLSNHGGRQLDSSPSPMEILPYVVQEVGSGLDVFVDGGIRRGGDIAKAMALGAKAVFLGRAPLYGLAAKGPQGVREVVQILREEFEITLRLLGTPSVGGLDQNTLVADFRDRLARF